VIAIAGLADAITRLARLDLADTKARGLRAAGHLLHLAVTESLSHPPGANPALPALRSGALRASIAQASDGASALVAATSPVAVFLEHGTARMAPRPFLGPAAARHADGAAAAIADTLRAEISA